MNNQNIVIKENILENVSTLQIKSMLSNALRFYNNVNHNIEENKVYDLSMKFSINDKKIVTIDNLSIIESVDEIIIPELSMDERYNEYDTLISKANSKKGTKEKVNDYITDLKIDLSHRK